MAGAYPKPDSQRARVNKPTFEWVRLPESGNAVIPPMPHGNWHERTAAWWSSYWAHPCAVMWRADDPCHERLAQFQDIVHRTGVLHNAATLTEIRQLEDRLGLTPKARMQLRWLIVPDTEADASPASVELAIVVPFEDSDKAKRQRKDPRRTE